MNDRTSKAEIERKGWEHMVLELLLNKNGNPSENVLLEFTATLPENAEVQQKYADKIITKFGLKEFLQKRLYQRNQFGIQYAGQERASIAHFIVCLVSPSNCIEIWHCQFQACDVV